MTSARTDLAGDLPVLTGLRAVAALWVLVYHAWVQAGPRAIELSVGATTVALHPVLALGWAGVDIFFVLSAFLLTLPFALARARGEAAPPLRRYFTRRALRIVPAYYAQLALVVAVAWISSGEAPTLRVVLAHLALWLNLGPDPVEPLVGVWWTLPVEFGFYLLLPLLAHALAPRRAVALLVGALAVTIAYRYLAFDATRALDVGYRVVRVEQLPGRLDQFVLGMLAAHAMVRAQVRGIAPSQRVALATFFAGIIGMALLGAALGAVHETYWDGHPLLFVWHALFALPILAVIAGAIHGGALPRALLANRAILWVGTISYSVYLWHQTLIREIHRLVFAGAGDAVFAPLLALGLAATLAVASAWYFCFERPFLRSRRTRAGAIVQSE